MNFSLSFSVLASALLASTYGFDVETELAIDNLIENVFMINNRIPGLGMSVVRNGEVLMSKGYGMKNIEAGLASNNNTLYAIGSISKSFIAVLVVKTLNKMYPQLDVAVLDVPLSQLIPSTSNFTLSDRFRAKFTTFRDLLAHRTCLITGDIDLIFGTLSSASEYAYRSRFLPQACDFRNGFVYNNNMLSLAGEIIASIAGTTLPAMLISFLRDLGMANTTYIDVGGSFESLPDMSLPYVIKDDRLVEFDMNQIRKFHIALGAGGILSTSNDMAKYMNFHLNLGRVGDKQIVPQNVLLWLYTVSNPQDFQGGRNEELGAIVAGDLGLSQGLMAGLYDGWNVIHHGGYLPPYHCDMRLFPATKIGVFICANGPGVIYNFPYHDVVATSIFELVRGTPQSLDQILYNLRNIGKPFVEHQISKGNKKNTDQAVLDQIQIRVKPKEVVGLYGHPYHGVLTITYEPDNATLQINFSEFAIGRLLPVSGFPTCYSVEWITGIMDHFYTYPWPAPYFWVEFGITDTVLFRAGELELYDEFEFARNATLDTFPPIPWTPTSCGPESENEYHLKL